MTDDDSKPTCRVVGAGTEVASKQGHLRSPAISAQSVGAQAIHMQLVRIPPGGRAKAHKHEGHETALHVLSGESGMWYGEKLEHHLIAKAGDFLYIPANMPHLPYNLSDAESCVAVMQPQANRERIIIRTSLAHALPPVIADARALRQITPESRPANIYFAPTVIAPTMRVRFSTTRITTMTRPVTRQ